jgi:soluble lytic murein transglycosylase
LNDVRALLGIFCFRAVPWWVVLSLLIVQPAAALASSASVEKDFKAAYAHYQKGRMDRFERHATRIPKHHPLYSYIDFWRLKADNASPDLLIKFVDRYPNSPLADRYRHELAGLYALADNWPAFRTQFQQLDRPSQELSCFDLHLRVRDVGREGNKEALEQSIALWRSSNSLPQSCTQLFNTLFSQGRLTQEDLYQRLRLALDANNLTLATALNDMLPAEERMQANTLAMAQRRGDELIQSAPRLRSEREAALYALTLFARLDPAGAAHLWENHAAKFAESEQRYGWGQIAMNAARKHDPLALGWFSRAGLPNTAPFSELQAMWRVRAALRAGQWQEVYWVIESMPAKMKEESVWRYWRARALKSLNAHFPANQILARLSQENDYYGFLALEELPPRIESQPSRYQVTPADLTEAETNPGLQLALTLRRMDFATDAQAEWMRALQGMTDRQLIAAAELALRAGWHDRAIITALRTKSEHNFDLRFIVPYRDLASAYASEYNLDEAWVYGLIRQESRFVAHARSRVGAQGLMQIMPNTATWIADQLGLNRKVVASVNKPETNIQFGTYYLKRIYDSLDQSPVMATAGYNAGPGRASKWQADTPLEGAIYVESIPFQETRDYVKRVMTNAMFYRMRFGGEKRSLKDRLGTIPARKVAPPSVENEAQPSPD